MRRTHSSQPLQAVCILLLAAPGATLAAASDTADAANPSADAGIALQEIVVTATRRESSIQDVPVAISAISGAALKDRGIVDGYQLSGLAPSLNVDQGQGNGETHVSIRGLSSTSFGLEANSPISTYIDDVYQSFMFGNATQMFDMNRIEVLRGPQGTLFGRNTTGGSLNYYTQAPTKKEEGYVNLDVSGGEFRRYSLEGALNEPLGDTLATRFSFKVDRRDAYIDNLYDGTKLGAYLNYNARVQFAWTPSQDTRVELKLFGLRSTGDANVYVNTGYSQNPCETFVGAFFLCDANGTPAPPAPDNRHVYSEAPQFERYDNFGAVLNVKQSFGDYTLTSISNVQKAHYKVATNDDGAASDFFHSRQASNNWQASEELRLATPASAPLSAVVGLFSQYTNILAKEGSVSSSPLVDPLFQNALDQYNGEDDTSLAAFSSITYKINNVFSLVGGLRESYEHIHESLAQLSMGGRQMREEDVIITDGLKDFDPAFGDLYSPLDAAHNWNRFTWDITANAKPTENSLLYAKVGTGFRSGGIFTAPAGSDSLFVVLAPELVKNYELGWKSEWLEHRLRVNGAAYWMDYNNLQVQTTNANGPGLAYSNAATARVKGIELEVDASIMKGLTLSGGLGYSHASFLNYQTLQFGVPVNLSGNPLPYAPQWTGNFAASYEYLLGAAHSVSFDTNWSYRSAIFFDPNALRATEDPSRIQGSIRISYGQQDHGWRVAGYVNNVNNVNMKAFSYFAAGGNSILIAPAIYAPGRTFGGQFSYSF
jgi:iron complex outermembrane recepter protein